MTITGISIITPIKDVSITVFKIVLLRPLLRFNNINVFYPLTHLQLLDRNTSDPPEVSCTAGLVMHYLMFGDNPGYQ